MVSIFFYAIWPSRWRKSRKQQQQQQLQQQQQQQQLQQQQQQLVHDIPAVCKDIPEMPRAEFPQFEEEAVASSGLLVRHYDDTAAASSSTEDDLLRKMGVSQGSECSMESHSVSQEFSAVACHTWGGNWYSFIDLHNATDAFAASNVIGEGGYGIVYKGRVSDGTQVAIKYLTNKGQADKEFMVEVETLGRVRHKNLVRMLGYCAEREHRLLVYEYVDNGNLEEWLHGATSRNQTPSWDARMKIVLGTARGIAYLHEALEPKIVHRDIKASNILLDSHWNAKVADFGLAKLLGKERTHVMTRVMGTFGYVAPEYASTGLLNERSDVYSFGVLLMEVVTGRDPVDYSRPPGEVNLVDWLKMMLCSRRLDEVADPRLEEKPSPRALKKALRTALQCVHPDVSKRPSMGHVVHTLEAESFRLPELKWRNVKEAGLSKLIESQKQHRIIQLDSFTKELQSCKLADCESPKPKRRADDAHQRHRYEA